MSYVQVREGMGMPVDVNTIHGPKPILPPLHLAVGYRPMGGMAFSTQPASTAALEFETKRMLDRFSFDGINIGGGQTFPNNLVPILGSHVHLRPVLKQTENSRTGILPVAVEKGGRREEHLIETTVGKKGKCIRSKNKDLPLEARKKYFCKICSRGFTTSGHLARHNRIHTGEKKHVCQYPGCLQRFSRHDNCVQHYRTHFKNSNPKTGV